MVSKKKVSESWCRFKLSRMMLSKKNVSRKKKLKKRIVSCKKTSPKSAPKTICMTKSSGFDRLPGGSGDSQLIHPTPAMESGRPDRLPGNVTGYQLVHPKADKGLTTFAFVYGGVVTVAANDHTLPSNDGRPGFGFSRSAGAVQNVFNIDSRMIIGDCEVFKSLLEDLKSKYRDGEPLEGGRIPVVEEASPARDMTEEHGNDVESPKDSSAWNPKSILYGIFNFWRKS